MNLKQLFGASALVMGLSFAGAANADIPPPQHKAAPKTKTVVVTFAAGATRAAANLKAGDTLDLRVAANPSTGYQWSVTSTTRSLGYPEMSYHPAAGSAIGGGGTTTLRWKTNKLSVGASQTVKLAYSPGPNRRGPVHLYTLVVNVAR